MSHFKASVCSFVSFSVCYCLRWSSTHYPASFCCHLSQPRHCPCVARSVILTWLL